MLLSITAHCRDDDYAHNFRWRLQTVVNRIGRNLVAAGAGTDEVEIVLCDWGSVAPMIGAIDVEQAAGDYLRYLYVPPGVAAAADGESPYSTSHANNTVVRRIAGRYVLAVDSDVYWREDTMRVLLGCVRRGEMGGHGLDEAFFWAARHHVPKAYNMTCPGIEPLDEFIDRNEHTFVTEKPNKSNFEGAAVALLASRRMWDDCGGLHEGLRFWGQNDLDIHRRLCLGYRWGGDMDDLGMKFYHFEHYYNRNNMMAESPRRANDPTPVGAMNPNGPSWGLADVPGLVPVRPFLGAVPVVEETIDGLVAALGRRRAAAAELVTNGPDEPSANKDDDDKHRGVDEQPTLLAEVLREPGAEPGVAGGDHGGAVRPGPAAGPGEVRED